jgi:hypothetical protein
MPARLLYRERRVIAEDRFVDLVVWQLPSAAPASRHRFKYRLAFVVEGECVLRFDNEAGKGDHKHLHGLQQAYSFTTLERLMRDFWKEVEAWHP